MELAYKLDFDQAARRWRAFWTGDLLDRPPTMLTVRRPEAPERPGVPQIAGLDGDFGGPLDAFEAWAETMYFAGESLPCFVPSFGPDQYAAFLGCEIITPPDSGDTSWVVPCISEWDDFLPVRLDPGNHYWRLMREFYEACAQRAQGKFLVGALDAHAGVDALAAARGYQQMLLDMMDQPEVIDRAAQQIAGLLPQVYETLWRAGGMDRAGWCSDWSGIGFPGNGCMTQSDFSAMLSPAMFRRWALPTLEREWEYLNYNFYHLDGPECLVHLPDLLAAPRLHGIQWVAGAGHAAQYTWVDIFQKIQGAGKRVQVWGQPEQIKWLHPQLKPNLVVYSVEGVASPAQADELLDWLVRNS